MAAYCADKLPGFLKATEEYKAGDMEKALVTAFLGLDTTIATPEVVEVLKEIAKGKKGNTRRARSANLCASQLSFAMLAAFTRYGRCGTPSGNPLLHFRQVHTEALR